MDKSKFLQEYYTWEEQAFALEQECNDFFGRTITLTPRAKAAFQADGTAISDHSAAVMYPDHVLESLLCACPAYVSLLICAGAQVSEVRSYGWREPGRPTPDLFRDMFCDFPAEQDLRSVQWRAKHPDEYFTPEAHEVKRTGLLSERALFGSLLRTMHRTIGCKDIMGYASNILLGSSSGAVARTPENESRIQTLAERSQQLLTIDPSFSDNQWMLFLDEKGRLRVVPFGVFTVSRLPLSDTPETVSLVRTGIQQPLWSVDASFSTGVLEEFEDLLNTLSASEAEFQSFFEKHPEFLKGLDYRYIHPQMILSRDTGPEFRPDFILEPMASSFCDILDIKLPYEALVVRLRQFTRVRFRAAINEYVAQLTEYKRYFEDRMNREAFYRKYNLHCYRPKCILVVGRRHHFRSDLERQEMKDVLPAGLEIWTYDDILARAKSYRELLH
jgi:hypothetical protein